MKTENVQSWDKHYSEKTRILNYPDETVVSYVSVHKNQLEGKKAIDIGCGCGRHSFLLRDYGMDVTAIDGSKAAIDYATKKAEKLGLDHIKFQTGLVQDIEVVEEKYELIIIWGVLFYLDEKDRTKLIQNAYKMLKKGGHLLCTLRSKEDTEYDLKENEKQGQLTHVSNFFHDNQMETAKSMEISFWTEEEAEKLFSDFSKVQVGHRILKRILRPGKIGHILIGAVK